MQKPDDSTRPPMSEQPQPLAGPGEQQPQHFQYEDEADDHRRVRRQTRPILATRPSLLAGCT